MLSNEEVNLQKCAPCTGCWDDKGNIYCRYDQDMETSRGPEENKKEFLTAYENPTKSKEIG